MDAMPVPAPRHPWCPGVFGRGCGGQLRLVTLNHDVQNEGQTAPKRFWGCEHFPSCAYREFVVERRTNPRMLVEATSQDAFRVLAAPGAEDLIRHCGGLRAVLAAAGIDAGSDTGCEADYEEQVLFGLPQYAAVRAALLNNKSHGLQLTDRNSFIPPPTLAALRGQLHLRVPPEEVEQRYAAMPAPISEALLPFQREGVRYALERQGRALIADEMGVGKTVQAIAVSACYKDDWPLLIIVPASLRLVWAEEFEKWLPHIRPALIHVIESRTDRLQAGTLPQVVITSYEMMARLTCDICRAGPVAGASERYKGCTGPDHCMAARGWRMIIVDESHTLRTTNRPPDSRHTEAVVAAAWRARRLIFLSGTPSLTRPFDLFRQVDALRPGLLGNKREEFALHYCGRRLVPSGSRHDMRMRWDNSGISRGGELHALLKKEVMLRRLKQDVMAQLPRLRRSVIRLPKPKPGDWPPEGAAPAEQKKRKSGSQTDDGEADEDEAAEAEGFDSGCEEEVEGGLPGSMTTDHRTALAKLPSALEWLKQALSGGGETGAPQPKMLIFAHHRDVMGKLATFLEGASSEAAEWHGVPYVRIEGATDPHDRRDAMQRFRADLAIRVALLSVTAAGTGLDFSCASTVVFVELPQEVSLVRQAEDRAHRQGQLLPVNSYFLCAKATSDERRWEHLSRSLERVTTVQDADRGPPGGLRVDAVYDADEAQLGLTQINPALAGRGLTGKDSDGTDCCSNAGAGSGQFSAPDEAAAASGGATLPGPQASTPELPPQACQVPKQAPSTAVRRMDDLLADMDREMRRIEDLGALTPEPALEGALKGAAGRKLADLEEDIKLTVWFEVSGNTNRIHFHGAADGGLPLGLSLPIELLTLTDGVPQTIADLLQQVDLPPAERKRVGPTGVMALPDGLTRAQLELMLADAREFAAEWVEMRSIIQSRLVNRVLRSPLKEAIDELAEQAQRAGAYGTATERYLAPHRPDVTLPEDAAWCPVRVSYRKFGKVVEYQQAFTSCGQRLCIWCLGPVAAAARTARDALLQGAMDLFCSGDCEAAFCVRSSGGALRRGLFKLERGVCQICKLDAHGLVQRVRSIEKGCPGWEAKRLKLVRSLAPKFTERGYKVQLERLVKHAVEGNAWHADHIIPVYKGGGLCDLENLRTLCVVCHMVVTKQQARERAEERRAGAGKQGTLDAFLAKAKSRSQSQEAPTATDGEPSSKTGRPKRLQLLYVDCSEDEDAPICLLEDSPQPATCGTPSKQKRSSQTSCGLQGMTPPAALEWPDADRVISPVQVLSLSPV